MYYRNEDRDVGVLNDLDMAAVIPSSGAPNTDRTGTIPFMALQLFSGWSVVHMFRHDVESFLWVFLWVCGCSDGSSKEVLVDPYEEWRELGMRDCTQKRRLFLSDVTLDAINVSEHHARNALFCLFLARLLKQLRTHIWHEIPTRADHNSQEQKDMERLKYLLPRFQEVRAELNSQYSPKDWLDDAGYYEIQRYILKTVVPTIDQLI